MPIESVTAQLETLAIPTYGLGSPEKNPVFFENRVYQGSSGKVYPVPFIDKIFQDEPPQLVNYQSARLENAYVRLIMLPELGGRIFLGQDKTNDNYDFFYRQDVIKPALVGLAGPWISGGVEFNWPQHHRPGTYLPTDVTIEDEGEGVYTIWMSEHDPLNRMKGMHGIRLRPGSSLIELRVRLFNRTPFTQTFLWWANAAAKVHDQYQSFFPTDVHHVADHAVRAMSSFPEAHNCYYGIDYSARPGENDLTWYKNIPVPASYMVCESQFGFFGGYDGAAQGGFVHVANRHISPGKKQWTWGNHAFGRAWDRELTDENGPYIELMAGVYTDNQPDFSYLLPYETKSFSQYWWPYQKIGPVQNATQDAALRLVLNNNRTLDFGAVASRSFKGARILLRNPNEILFEERIDLSPDSPWHAKPLRFEGDAIQNLELALLDAERNVLIAYRPVETSTLTLNRKIAKELPLPKDIEKIEDLWLAAEHLEQYRHPTRHPETYWSEALKRDPLDIRTNIAEGRYRLKQGCLDWAAGSFEKTIQRLTHCHPNPCTGEAHYHLGIVRRYQGLEAEAYAALYKATWNYEWRAAAYFQLATLDCRQGDFCKALEHCESALDTNRQNNKAHVLKAIVLRKTGHNASPVLMHLLKVDSLDHWAHYESGDIEGFLVKCRNDAQTILDIVYDYADAGFYAEACTLLELHHDHRTTPSAVPNPLERSPQTYYTLAWLKDCLEKGSGMQVLDHARKMSPNFFFPSRLHDQLVLEWALAQEGLDRNAAFGLGNYLYDRKRHEESIQAWELACRAAPTFATAFRNLGIAYWNVRSDGKSARESYLQALKNDPDDSRIFFEYDQLRQKLNDPVEARLEALESRDDLVKDRDDCTLELVALYNRTGKPQQALDTLMERRFHPWEGGEGKVVRQYATACLLLGRKALTQGNASTALQYFERASNPPDNLGEKYHPLQSTADVQYWTGIALRNLGREEEAIAFFMTCAAEAEQFPAKLLVEQPDLSYWCGLSLRALGREEEAVGFFQAMLVQGEAGLRQESKIDYFATSLPNLLVFVENLKDRCDSGFHLLMALAHDGLGQPDLSLKHLQQTSAFTNAGQIAAELADPAMEEI